MAEDNRLPQRKIMRLPQWNYSQSGAYFITVCVKQKQKLLWMPQPSPSLVGARIARPQTKQPYALSPQGETIKMAIENIARFYPVIGVEKYVIMPNHIHLLLHIRQQAAGCKKEPPTISNVINQMKGYVTKQTGVAIWQKTFYDHIVRDEQDYLKIWNYIDTNPEKWREDCFYVE